MKENKNPREQIALFLGRNGGEGSLVKKETREDIGYQNTPSGREERKENSLQEVQLQTPR